jgi:hypothetical protein
MVSLHIRFHHFDTFFMATQRIDFPFDVVGHVVSQYAVAVFRTEHDMILAFVD